MFRFALILVFASVSFCATSEKVLYQTKKWEAVWLKGAEPTKNQYIEFIADGNFTGFAGCNRILGPFETFDFDSSAGRINIGPIISTEMACPSLRSEKLFIIALEQTRFFEKKSGKLILLGADGKEKLAEFSPGQSHSN